MVKGHEVGSNNSRYQIGSATIDSFSAAGGEKRRLPPLSSDLQGARSICVSKKVYNNTLHTNPNCKIVQDGTNIMYNIIVLINTTKSMNNENITRNTLKKPIEVKT